MNLYEKISGKSFFSAEITTSEHFSQTSRLRDGLSQRRRAYLFRLSWFCSLWKERRRRLSAAHFIPESPAATPPLPEYCIILTWRRSLERLDSQSFWQDDSLNLEGSLLIHFLCAESLAAAVWGEKTHTLMCTAWQSPRRSDFSNAAQLQSFDVWRLFYQRRNQQNAALWSSLVEKWREKMKGIIV